MTFLRSCLLAWSKILTALTLATLAACSFLGSLAIIHRIARHPGPAHWHASYPAYEYHLTWVWGGRLSVFFLILSAIVLAHCLARLTQYSLRSRIQN